MQSPHTTSLKRRLYYNAKQRRSKRQTTTSATIIDNTQLRFLVPISFGDGGTLDAELDTGSSDTWLIQTGFQCYSSNSFSATSLEPQSYCNFGGTYSPGSTFEAINGVHQRSCYGNGARCVAGPLGWTSVTIAGVTVPQQVVGAPNQSSYPAIGLPEQSGIVGMAFPSISTGYSSTGQVRPYDALMQTMFNDDAASPPLPKMFSLAISRDASGTGNGGTLTIGGIPPLTDSTVNATTSFSAASFQVYPGVGGSSYSYYAIYVDGFVSDAVTYDPDVLVIVDSGADVLQVPTSTAQAFNSLWSPAAGAPSGGGGGGVWTIACDATLSSDVGITIGGATYYIHDTDLIGTLSDGTCYSLVQDGGTGATAVYIVGDPLLRNVVAVYDWGASEMVFYPRMYYES